MANLIARRNVLTGHLSMMACPAGRLAMDAVYYLVTAIGLTLYAAVLAVTIV
ncbi:MAG: hypothetical protein AAFS07_11090 [Pseudomonadota bacterium]